MIWRVVIIGSDGNKAIFTHAKRKKLEERVAELNLPATVTVTYEYVKRTIALI